MVVEGGSGGACQYKFNRKLKGKMMNSVSEVKSSFANLAIITSEMTIMPSVT